MKKLLAVLLAAATVASIGVTAFAATSDPIDQNEFGSEMITERGKVHPAASDVVFPGKTVYINMNEAFIFGFDSLLAGLDKFNPDKTKAILSPSTAYYQFGNLLTDKKLTSLKVKKEEGSKLLKSISLVQRAADSNVTGYEVTVAAEGRSYKIVSVDNIKFRSNPLHMPQLKIVFNDFLTDDEQKVEGYIDVKFKKDIVYSNNHFIELPDGKTFDDYAWYIAKDTKIRIPFSFWLNNLVLDVEDDTQEAGTGGTIYKPAKNEENEWTYEDQNNTIATVRFAGDDDQGKAYSKLSTVWDKDYYAEHFEDQDAFLYDFIASPSLAATSRATIELRVPFVDEDGDLTCDESEIHVYVKDADGELTDVTSQWKLTESEDDEYVMTSRGRQLLTYVLAGPLGAAEEVEEVPEEGVPTGVVLSAYASK